ncbi:MAG: hypothetical protein V3U75_13185 [Methylococcaceae bacterium]
MPYLIAVDPHLSVKKPAGVAIFVGKQTYLIHLYRWSLATLLEYTASPYLAIEDRHAVIEKPYVGVNPKQSIELAIICGKIAQVFSQQGFGVHWADSWGSKSAWTKQALGRGRKIPKREDAKRLSIMKAKGVWSGFGQAIDEHTADAANIGQWWLDNHIPRLEKMV